MSAPSDRRGFLRGLVSLPLIGGGVTLLGAPSAVAEPVTVRLLREYHDWLMYERHELAREIQANPRLVVNVNACWGAAWRWHRARGPLCLDSDGDAMGDGSSFPSGRAALVMSAVGCNWREGDARCA